MKTNVFHVKNIILHLKKNIYSSEKYFSSSEKCFANENITDSVEDLGGANQASIVLRGDGGTCHVPFKQKQRSRVLLSPSDKKQSVTTLTLTLIVAP